MLLQIFGIVQECKEFFYFSYIPWRYRRSAKARNKKYSYSRPRSNRPLAWFLRPLNYYLNKSLFRCVISIYCKTFWFCCCSEDKQLLYQTFLRLVTFVFVSTNFNLCVGANAWSLTHMYHYVALITIF